MNRFSIRFSFDLLLCLLSSWVCRKIKTQTHQSCNYQHKSVWKALLKFTEPLQIRVSWLPAYFYYLGPISSGVSQGLSSNWHCEISNSSQVADAASHQALNLGFKQHQSALSVNTKARHSLHNLCPGGWIPSPPSTSTTHEVHPMYYVQQIKVDMFTETFYFIRIVIFIHFDQIFPHICV